MTTEEKTFEQIIEAAYWRFDSRRSGYNNLPPVAERDAFKQECRRLVNTAVDMLEAMEKEENKLVADKITDCAGVEV